MKIFSGRVAFVTGGASGIGYGMVQNFLKLGESCVLFAPQRCSPGASRRRRP